jgi:hypothetical protein
VIAEAILLLHSKSYDLKMDTDRRNRLGNKATTPSVGG